MTLQTLNPPSDITWRRMAYSRDMIDTNFGDMAFPPKWRTSLSVYYYVVPEEDTVDAYPDQRVVYLKLVASVTGWNPSEDLVQIRKDAAEGDALDDLQNSIWDVIEASGWASKYWGCYGAIISLGIYPSKSDNVGVDDYPYITDFEPKKRELYEAVTEGEELLSGSSDKTNIRKGTTSVENMELNGFSVFGIGVSGKLGGSTTRVEEQTTDALRESRETRSRTTSSSQMYQLFNGYHLGTNRGLFVISPRPHSITGSFNLLDGERKLEGLQDIFLVVTMPRSLKGFCIQASIDTGHKNPDNVEVTKAVRTTVAMRAGEFSDPPCLGGTDDGSPDGGIGGGFGGGGGTTTPPDQPGFTFMVTRRTIQACGTFDDADNLILEKVASSGGTRGHRPPVFVGDLFIGNPQSARAVMKASTWDPPEGGFDDCRQTHARIYNRNMARMTQSMIDIFSSGTANPVSFAETKTFKALFLSAARRAALDIDDLRTHGYINDKELDLLRKHRIHGLSDLLGPQAEAVSGIDLGKVRSRLLRPKSRAKA